MSTITVICDSCRGPVVALEDGSCGWCGGATRERQRGGGRPKGSVRRLNEAQVRAAHVIYQERELSLRDLGKLLWERFGYKTPASCANALSEAFIELGLPRRARLDATIAKSQTHGRASRRDRDPGYRRWLREQRGDYQPRCIGTRRGYPNRGRPCPRPAMVGSAFCRGHDPELEAERQEQMAAVRAKAAV